MEPGAIDPAGLYLEHLPLIDRIAEALCRRNGIRGADAEDFAAEARLKLLQDDYAVLRKFRGSSSVPTFLTVVIGNLFRDYRIRMWGRWRPSAEAKRFGEVAVLLETAMYRDGRSFEDACATLERDQRLSVDRAELRRILTRLPLRAPRRIEGESSLSGVASAEEADDNVLEREREDALAVAERAVNRALAELDPEDQLIVRLRFFEGLQVVEIARALGVPQKPLYSRIQRLLRALSDSLERDGIGPGYLDSLNSAVG